MGQGVIPDDWLGEYCRYTVCWPNSPQWLAVLRGVLTFPARGRFWDETTGDILNAQDVIRETFDTNLHLEEVILSCNDEALTGIANALMLLAQNQCCGEAAPQNGGIQVIIQSPLDVATPIYGSVPPASLEPGNVPPLYPGTLEEYDADKCRTAAAIVTGTIATLRNFSYISFAQTTGLTLVIIAAIAGAIIIPQFMIPVLIAAAIVTVGLNAGLVALADAIEAEYNDWVCWLYEGESTSVIVGVVSDGLDALISAIPATGVLALTLKTIALIIMDTDTLNQLFTMSQGQGAEFNCDVCTEETTCFEFTDNLEGFTILEDLGGIVTMVWDSGDMRVNYSTPPPDYCQIISPTMSYVIQSGDVANVCVTAGVTLGCVAGIKLDGDLVQLYALGTGAGDLAMDLTAYDGQTLEGIYFGYAGAGLATLTIQRVGVNCPC